MALTACGRSLPRPRLAAVHAEDYVPVPQPPQVPIVEVVPSAPRASRPLWVDGAWEWSGSRYRWRSGGWIEGASLPDGARYAPWAVVRRKDDGQLFFAASSFRDGAGRMLPMPAFLARAETTPGEATLVPEVRRGGGALPKNVPSTATGDRTRPAAR